MFYHPGHFLIYDKNSRYCVFDATYISFDKQETSPDEIVAVIYEIKINKDTEKIPIIEDDFGLLASLIEKDL